jgi:hypothetical protein
VGAIAPTRFRPGHARALSAARGQVLQILGNLGEAGANQGFMRPEPIIVLILSCALRTAGNQASRLVLGQ